MTNRSYAEQVLTRVGESFRQRRDPDRAAAMSRYMRGRFSFFGISVPAQRRIAREAIADLEPPGERDLLDLALRCWTPEEREWQQLGCWYLARYVSAFSAGALPVVERLITTKSWWDTVDDLASHTVGPLVAAQPRLAGEMDRWAGQADIWLARAAILHQLRFKERTDAARLFRHCELRAADPEFFVRKAIGWALREYSKTDPAAVRGFVAGHRDELSALSAREATRLLVREQPHGRVRGR